MGQTPSGRTLYLDGMRFTVVGMLADGRGQLRLEHDVRFGRDVRFPTPRR